ncbi:hypothetical protein [Candidatus Electronema sp. PJ]|uniref:hypothetical protein n=1 Tax=Candidatus Electronema sp. PJ TaxID=3401572 RepID=UPI003AA9009D
MNMLKNISARLLLGTAGVIMATAPVYAVELNPEMLSVVDEMVRKMQQETMQTQYAAVPGSIKSELPSRVMNNMYNSMYLYASSTYRQAIQPQMVQVVVGQLRPWELPGKFKQRMMPDIVAQVSSQIKDSQLQQMQEGINDPSFPNVPGLENQESSQAQ